MILVGSKPGYVFFDVGGPIYDDSRLIKVYLECIRDYFGVENDEFQADYDRFLRERAKSPYRALIRRYSASDEEARKAYLEIKDARGGSSLNVVREGLVETLQYLRGKGYGLGVIANQPPEVVSQLEKDGLLQYFSVLGISEVVGVDKPDVRLFEWALEQAHSVAVDCWFVGDRLDTDIAPAKKMGMHTIRIRVSDHAFDEPRNAEEEPDYTITDIRELKSIL